MNPQEAGRAAADKALEETGAEEIVREGARNRPAFQDFQSRFQNLTEEFGLLLDKNAASDDGDS